MPPVGQERQDWPGHSSGQRASVREAAELLGTTVDAIRKRVQRGTIPYEKDSDGRVWIVLDAVQDPAGHRQDTDQPQSDNSALISAKDETIAALHDQLEAERQAHAEARRIMAGLVERIPAIEAPQEPSEDAETVDEEPERAEPHSAAGEAQDELGAERARREMAESMLHEGMTEERRRREAAERERDDLRRELYARSRQQGAHETAEEAPDRAEPRSATVGAQEGARRPWWRRIVGR
jgi:hypothetical protein